MEIETMTALELGKAVKDRKLGCVELAKAILGTVRVMEPHTNAYITVAEENAIKEAAAVQARLDSGEDISPIAGVPAALGDNICTADMPATCASKMLEGFRPPYNATAMEKLRKAGAIVLGKLNMDEFGMGCTSESSYFGAAKNPWDCAHTPGSGSGAALAAGEAAFTLGSDTGGEARQSGSFCGASVIKPTYGAVSRYGLVAYASSMDQIAPMGKTIADCAAVLTQISGHDPRDSTSLGNRPFDFTGCFNGDVKGLKIGLPHFYFGDGVNDGVKAAVLSAARTLETLGASINEFELPFAEHSIHAHYVIACAEASSNMSRYDGIRFGLGGGTSGSLADAYIDSRSEGFGPEVKRRIMMGAFMLSAGNYNTYYEKAQQARDLISRALDEAFERYDVILCPASPVTAYKLGENLGDKAYLDSGWTAAASLTGLPAVTAPCGFDGKLPVGAQMIGKALSEPVLVRAAHAFQMNTDYHLRRPDITNGGIPQ